MDYINTSHPNFIGGSKAVEVASQQVKSSRVPHPITRPKVCLILCIGSHYHHYIYNSSFYAVGNVLFIVVFFLA